jgi:hypothetical protein
MKTGGRRTEEGAAAGAGRGRAVIAGRIVARRALPAVNIGDSTLLLVNLHNLGRRGELQFTTAQFEIQDGSGRASLTRLNAVGAAGCRRPSGFSRR